jgi:hypothetical protein
MVKEDPRPLPRATEAMEVESPLRLLCPVGGMPIFSSAQMHSSVPNTSGRTRFSIDFRMVDLEHARSRRGAPKSDEQCTGTTRRDYLCLQDFSCLPESIVAMYDDNSAEMGSLIYTPPQT